MENVRPLRMQREKFVLQGPTASTLPIARVWVDSGVPHLDGTYDYFIPEKFTNEIHPGVRVSVPFASREVEAIILERLHSSDATVALKKISKVLSPVSIATPVVLELISRVARHWGAHPYDIIRSAIPPRVVAAENEFINRKLVSALDSPSKASLHRKLRKEGTFAFYSHGPSKDPFEDIAHLAVSKLNQGGVLVLVPDEADLERLERILSREIDPQLFTTLGSSISRSNRYFNFLSARFGVTSLVIGTRSAIFAPITNLGTIIISSENSEQYYDPRTPGWNVRDVAIIRKDVEDISLIFTGYSPSTQLSSLIEDRRATYVSSSTRVAVSAYPQSSGELLPDRIISPIRKSLLKGSVLMLVPRKGYGNALLCGKCKNSALCECGGRISVASAQSDPQCSVCANTFPNWRCGWCQGNTRYLAARGIDRAAEEIGRAFPKQNLVISSGENISRTITSATKIVVATPGAVPHLTGGYQAVVLLEGTRFFAGTDMRSQERATEFFFDSAAHVSHRGEVLVAIDPSHPIVAALTRWNPIIIAQRYLRERKEISFPPYVTSAIVDCPSAEISTLKTGFQRSVDQMRLPSGTRILGPTPFAKGLSRLVILTPLNQREELVNFLLELAKRRSIAKKIPLIIRFDPYSLT